jgi:hypothetical protein
MTLALFAAGALQLAEADSLELRDGSILQGNYMGGSQTSMRFETGGEVRVIPITDVLALTISGRSGGGATAAATGAGTAAAAAPTALPAGAVLLVQTSQSIDTRSNKAGSLFTATLEGNLVAGNKTIAPAGAQVYGRVVTAKRGGAGARKPVLELQLTEIMIDGARRKLSSEILKGTGEGGGAGRKVAKGAAVGALADGSKGAETGAKIGLGVAILAGGRHAGVAAGTLLEFRLAEPFSLL